LHTPWPLALAAPDGEDGILFADVAPPLSSSPPQPASASASTQSTAESRLSMAA
jgi:hypothetical protein